jgi:hypothetical protein
MQVARCRKVFQGVVSVVDMGKYVVVVGMRRSSRAILVALGESDAFEDSNLASHAENESDENIICIKNGYFYVEWTKMERRTVDPFVQKGCNKRAEFKLHNYIEKSDRAYFEAMFPWDLIPKIVSLMAARERVLGYGPTGQFLVGRDIIFVLQLCYPYFSHMGSEGGSLDERERR